MTPQWRFRLSFTTCTVVLMVAQNLVGAVILVAIAVAYTAELHT